MTEFDEITAREQFVSWLEQQTPEVRQATACRASLRSLPAIMKPRNQHSTPNSRSRLTLACLRATLTSGVASNFPSLKESILATAAEAANTSILSALSADDTSVEAAAQAARAAVLTFSVLASHAVRYAADAIAETAVFYSAHITDTKVSNSDKPQQIFTTPLWPSSENPSHLQDSWPLQENWEAFASQPDQDGAWSFWRDWYRGMLRGTPMDWDLQLRVALIEDVIWEAGPEAVAKEIERIQQEFSTPENPDNRFPEYEPQTVSDLIENRVVAMEGLAHVATQIDVGLTKYRVEYETNALPDAFAPLENTSAFITAITRTLKLSPATNAEQSQTEDQLRAEIGRFTANIAELEQNVAALKLEISFL